MGIDKETKPIISVTMTDSKEYRDMMRKQADENGLHCDPEDEEKYIVLGEEKHEFEMEEYYYEERDNTIQITGNLKCEKGESSIYINIPLSDIVLIDILQGSIKKLNKLKTALESLK